MREPLGHHVPVTSIVGGQPDPPQAIPQSIDLGLFDQAGEDPHGFDGPPNGDPKLMDVFDILVTFLGGEGKSVANGFEASVENSTCHLAHGLIRGDPDDPLTVRRDCGWFRFEKLFGHWRLSPWRSGKAPSLCDGPIPPAHTVSDTLGDNCLIVRTSAPPARPTYKKGQFDC